MITDLARRAVESAAEIEKLKRRASVAHIPRDILASRRRKTKPRIIIRMPEQHDRGGAILAPPAGKKQTREKKPPRPKNRGGGAGFLCGGGAIADERRADAFILAR